MDRRAFLKSAMIISVGAGIANTTMAAERYFPTNVDQSLFGGINRVKEAGSKSPLEKSHVPVITAPSTLKTGEPFTVDVSVGEVLHPMSSAHWIQYIELAIGNEPAGRIDFQPKGYMKPIVRFTVALSADATAGGKVTLVARQSCNLHGLWEESFNIALI